MLIHHSFWFRKCMECETFKKFHCVAWRTTIQIRIQSLIQGTKRGLKNQSPMRWYQTGYLPQFFSIMPKLLVSQWDSKTLCQYVFFSGSKSFEIFQTPLHSLELIIMIRAKFILVNLKFKYFSQNLHYNEIIEISTMYFIVIFESLN